MTEAEGISFTVETEKGPVRAIVSHAALRSLSGRSHVSGQELVVIYRSELEDIVHARIRRQGIRGVVRIEATDL